MGKKKVPTEQQKATKPQVKGGVKVGLDHKGQAQVLAVLEVREGSIPCRIRAWGIAGVEDD